MKYSGCAHVRENKLKYLGLEGHVAFMGEKAETYRVLVGKSEHMRRLGKPRNR